MESGRGDLLSMLADLASKYQASREELSAGDLARQASVAAWQAAKATPPPIGVSESVGKWQLVPEAGDAAGDAETEEWSGTGNNLYRALSLALNSLTKTSQLSSQQSASLQTIQSALLAEQGSLDSQPDQHQQPPRPGTALVRAVSFAGAPLVTAASLPPAAHRAARPAKPALRSAGKPPLAGSAAGVAAGASSAGSQQGLSEELERQATLPGVNTDALWAASGLDTQPSPIGVQQPPARQQQDQPAGATTALNVTHRRHLAIAQAAAAAEAQTSSQLQTRSLEAQPPQHAATKPPPAHAAQAAQQSKVPLDTSPYIARQTSYSSSQASQASAARRFAPDQPSRQPRVGTPTQQGSMVSLSDFPVSDSEASLQAEALGSAEVRRAIKREAVAAQDAARAAHEEAARWRDEAARLQDELEHARRTCEKYRRAYKRVQQPRSGDRQGRQRSDGHSCQHGHEWHCSSCGASHACPHDSPQQQQRWQHEPNGHCPVPSCSAAHRQPACVSGQAVVCRIEDTSASADFRKAVEQIQFEERIYRLKLQHNAELAKQAEDIERLRLGLDESQQAAGELQTELSIAQRDCEAARQAEQAATSKAVAQEVEVQHWMAGAREAAAGAERAQAAAAGLQAKMASMQEQHQQALSETQAEVACLRQADQQRRLQLQRVEAALVVPLARWHTTHSSGSLAEVARVASTPSAASAQELCSSEEQAAWLGAAMQAVLEAASGGQKTASRHRSKHDRALRKLQAELESLRAAEEAAYEGGRSRGLDEAQSELQDRLKEYHRLLDAERADTTAALELADKAQLEARSQIARMETRLVEAEQQAASMELQCQQARCELAKALVEKSNALTQSQALLDASSDTVQKQAAELVRLENELQQHQATLSSLRSSVDTAAAKELESKLSQRDALRWAADERELAATLAAELAKKEEALAQQGAKLSCLQAALQAEEARNAALSAEVAQHKQAEMRASEDIGNVQAALQSLRRRQAEMQSVVQRTCGADVSAGVGAFPTMFPGTLPGQSWT